MALPVEAQSLSTLINLAANPPQYPRNVTHEPLQPLTLYIVRVPGSQDVFLTPLRPPTRSSINVEAINTSLYYLHVLTAEEIALQEALNTKHSSQSEQSSPTKPIQRKPLPQSLHTNEAPQRAEPPQASYHGPPKSSLEAQGDPEAAAQGSRGLNLGVPGQHGLGAHDAARKPMGPRALPTRMHSIEEGSIKRKPVGGTEGNGRPRANTERLVRPLQVPLSTQGEAASYSTTERFAGEATSPNDAANAPWSNPTSPTLVNEVSNSLQITIIRRDPTSGTQWNVGSITSSNDPSSPDIKRIELRISTPGYQKFNRESSWPKIEDLDLSSLLKNREDILSQSVKGQTAAPMEPTPKSPESQVFTRYLTMPGPRTSRPRSSRNRSSSDPNALFQASLSKVTAPPPATRPPVFVPQLNSQQSMTQEHFSFLTPWNGRCTFSTAMDGRSLKGRHVLPVAGTTNEDSNPPNPVVVELRFNLPWPTVNFSSLRKRDTNTERERTGTRPNLADTAKMSWKSSMQKLKEKGLNREVGPLSSPPYAGPEQGASHGSRSPERRHRQMNSQGSELSDHDSESEGGHEPLDLSLGREKAGGGRGGQAAKLGKLIIRDEGLKMMDLVVAAGMGVWWGIHHREK